MKGRTADLIGKFRDLLLYATVRLFVFFLSALPLSAQRKLLASILRAVSKKLPRYQAIAYRNLSLVFPELSEAQKEAMYIGSFISMGDLLIELIRFPKLNEQWARNHIDFSQASALEALKKKYPDRGMVLATGHLGSFELSAFCLPFLYRPISFIVRNFSNPYLDKWWNKLRECSGNQVIPRKGAFKRCWRALREGRDVGILFDQNVTRQNAIFVSWFGKTAATTKAMSVLALQTQAPVALVAMIRTGTDSYLYLARECDCFDIYQNTEMSKDSKLIAITERVVSAYEALIRQYPESWFWIHRKWKTQPDPGNEDFYKSPPSDKMSLSFL